MKTHNTLFKQIAKLGLMLMVGLSMNACSGTKSWKEEVQLSDGKIIVVERLQTLGKPPTLESREGKILDEAVSFLMPGTNQKITWAMSFRNDVPEPNGVNVIVLDIVNNTAYIAGYPAGCIAYNKWNRPNPPQILFKYENAQWKRISLKEFPTEITQANLIVGGPPAERIKSFYSVEQVNTENHDIEEGSYKTIQREPVNGYEQNCPMLVRIEGGWVEPSGAKVPIPVAPRS